MKDVPSLVEWGIPGAVIAALVSLLSKDKVAEWIENRSKAKEAIRLAEAQEAAAERRSRRESEENFRAHLQSTVDGMIAGMRQQMDAYAERERVLVAKVAVLDTTVRELQEQVSALQDRNRALATRLSKYEAAVEA